MKTEDYLKRNMMGFEGDTQMRDEVQSLIKTLGITCVVETGTYKGGTTKVFSEMEGVEEVHTIEINDENFLEATEYLLKSLKTFVYKGSSEKVFRDLLPNLMGKKILFFLDAHWEEHCPLLEELEEIAAHGIIPLIIIHDFKVPGTTLGFDSYKGQDFEYEWVRPSLEKIYGAEHKYIHGFNLAETALGARRGALYVRPRGTVE